MLHMFPRQALPVAGVDRAGSTISARPSSQGRAAGDRHDRHRRHDPGTFPHRGQERVEERAGGTAPERGPGYQAHHETRALSREAIARSADLQRRYAVEYASTAGALGPRSGERGGARQRQCALVRPGPDRASGGAGERQAAAERARPRRRGSGRHPPRCLGPAFARDVEDAAPTPRTPGTREMSGAASTAGLKTSSTLDDSVIVFK